MRIDLGNFGNNQRQAVSTQVNRGDVTAIADAKVQAAQQQERSAQQVGQAFGQLAQNMQGVGVQMEQRNQELAQQKAAIVVQKKMLFAQGVVQEAQDQIDQGKLTSDQVKDFYTKSMAKFQPDEINGLWGEAQKRFETSLTGVDEKMSVDVNHLYRAAHKVETRAAVDEMASNTERLALNGGNLQDAEKVYDNPTFQANMREAYGASYGQKLTELKSNLYANHLQSQLINNRDNYAALGDLQKQITEEGGLYHGKLDANQQLSALGQIDNRKSTLEAKAEAARARAEAQAERAERQRMQADNQAITARDNAYELIASGYPLSDEQMEKLSAKLQGTSVAGDIKLVAAASTAIAQNSGGTFEQRQARIDVAVTQLKKTGATSEQVKILNIQQRTLDAQRQNLKKDSIGEMAQQLRQDVPPLNFAGIRSEGTPAEQRQSWQAFSEQLYQRKGLNDHARQLDASVPKQLLTPDERTAIQSELKNLPAPQRARMLATLQNAGGALGPQLIKEVGASDLDSAAAYHLNANPHVKTGDLILQGQDLISTKGNIYKAPEVSKTAPVIDDMYREAIPASQRNKLAPAIDAAYVALKAQAGGDPTKFDKDLYMSAQRRVVGDVTNFGGSKLVIPFGADASSIKSRLNSQIDALPDAENLRDLLDSGEAKLKAVGASHYMVVQKNDAPWADANHQPVYLTSD